MVIALLDEEITCSKGHRFYIREMGWVEAQALRPGYALVGLEQDVVLEQMPQPIDGEYQVYNLTVEDAHTYYVGRSQVLVHNAKYEYQHGGFIPFTGWYKLHANELVLNQAQWGALAAVLAAKPQINLDLPVATSDVNIIFNEPVYIREDADIERLARRVSQYIGDRAEKRARLGA